MEIDEEELMLIVDEILSQIVSRFPKDKKILS